MVVHLRTQEKEAPAGAWRAGDKLQVTTEKAHQDAEELAWVKQAHETLQKTIKRIRHERHATRQERDAACQEHDAARQECDLEAGRKVEVERVAADLVEEVSQLRGQVQGLQAVVSQGLVRECEQRACADG